MGERWAGQGAHKGRYQQIAISPAQKEDGRKRDDHRRNARDHKKKKAVVEEVEFTTRKGGHVTLIKL